MGRGDMQGLDSSSPAMCGLLCGRGWLVCLAVHMLVQLWQLRPWCVNATPTGGRAVAVGPIHGHVMGHMVAGKGWIAILRHKQCGDMCVDMCGSCSNPL